MQGDLYYSVRDTEVAHARAASLFDQVRARLALVLPATAIVQHVGATAVEGCITKGDLDIVVRVEEADFAQADRALETMFARNTGSVRTHSFAAFEDPGSDPPLGVQLTTIGGEFDVFHRFVEVLRRDPVALDEYNALKRAHEGRPIDEYRAAKDRFVASLLERR